MTTTSPITMTASQALAAYRAAYDTDGLIQGSWHTERDGRQLACGLGVLGPAVNGPADCPAQIMPRWLAQMVPDFFDRQKFNDAKDWGLRFYAALDRIGGKVPFSVVHDWNANTVGGLGIGAATLRKRDTAPHEALKALHLRALAGEKISADEWRPVLRDAYTDAYAYAYTYAYTDAYAYANADADANAYAYANANAYAYANADAYANAWKRLADGMVDALNRVEMSA